MLNNITILILGLLMTAMPVSAQKSGDKNTDETTIRANVEQLAKGWNAKSGAEFAKPFAEDAEYVIINGMQIQGRPTIANAHQGIFDTIYKNSTISLKVEKIRFLRPDVVVVHVFGTLKLGEGDSLHTNNARMTLVMTKSKDTWEISAFQNTEVQNRS